MKNTKTSSRVIEGYREICRKGSREGPTSHKLHYSYIKNQHGSAS